MVGRWLVREDGMQGDAGRLTHLGRVVGAFGTLEIESVLLCLLQYLEFNCVYHLAVVILVVVVVVVVVWVCLPL